MMQHATVSDHPNGQSVTQEGKIGRLRRRAHNRYSGSFADRFWSRLSATDFMSEAMQLAAIILLCFMPFAIVASALAGRNAVESMSRRLGLSHEAAGDLAKVIAPAHATSDAVSGAGYVLFILGGIALASSIGALYERLFGLEPRGIKNLPVNLAWLALVFVVSGLYGWVAPGLSGAVGPVVLTLLGLAETVLLFWFTIWLLLAGREPWKGIFPSALATAVCWIGMIVVFHFVFSDAIVGDYKKYGAIGVIFAFMSFFIAVGVVIILGAVSGLLWRERKHPVDSPCRDDPTTRTQDNASTNGSREVLASDHTRTA